MGLLPGKLTVADVLREESLQLRLVAGSKGVDNEVRGIHISEMPDPTRWLAPGDILLTTQLALHDDLEGQTVLVRRLAEAGIAGLGVAVDIYLGGGVAEKGRRVETGGHVLFLEEVRLGGRVEQVVCFVYPRGESVSEMGRVVVEYVRKLLTLELHRSRDEILLKKRMRASLLDDLLSGLGKSEDLEERLTHFGFEPDRAWTLMVCDIAHFAAVVGSGRSLAQEESIQRLKADFKEQVDGYFSDVRRPYLSQTKSDSVVVLVQLLDYGEDALRALGQELRRRLADRFPELSVTVGFGDGYRTAEAVPRAFTQAREATDARLGSGEGTHVRLFSDLGPRIRALENQSRERLEYFAEMTLGPLITYDEERGEHLLETLRVFLEADRTVARAASLLYVHPNTLRNRLHKVEELLGVCLEATDVLVDIALGFQALRILDRLVAAPRVVVRPRGGADRVSLKAD